MNFCIKNKPHIVQKFAAQTVKLPSCNFKSAFLPITDTEETKKSKTEEKLITETSKTKSTQ